ncbi:MAG: transcriptional repressor [Pseudomonadota bacterium]
MTLKATRSQTDVLDVLRQHGGALSAYDVLGTLRMTNPTISAPTIYRALAALAASGRVHRLASVSAYIAAAPTTVGNTAILSICDDCGLVEQNAAPDLLTELTKLAEQSGFSEMNDVIELHGRCASCVGSMEQA